MDKPQDASFEKGRVDVNKNQLAPFKYFGGKGRMLDKLYPLFPSHQVYVEPYMGGLSVLLNKPRSDIEVVNDINDEVVNFFRVVRDKHKKLTKKLSLTPYARDEYLASAPQPGDSDIERARKLFVNVRQGWGGKIETKPTRGKWAKPANSFHLDKARNNAFTFHKAAKDLYKTARRLQNVSIENSPALDVIKMYDSEHTFFYLDPPYVHSSREGTDDYGEFEMSNMQHYELADVLHNVKGKVMLSGYMNDIYDDLFYSWTRKDFLVQAMSRTGGTQLRPDSVWMNYDADQGSLFGE